MSDTISAEFDIKDEETLDDKMNAALERLADDFSEAYWDVKKLNNVTQRYSTVCRLPINLSDEDENVKDLIRSEKWGGSGTYQLQLYRDGQRFEHIPNVEFYIRSPKVIETIKKVEYPIHETKEKNNSVLNSLIVENIQTMKLQKEHKDLKKMLTDGDTKNNATTDLFAIMMQMNKEDQRRREEQEERRERAEEKREQERKELERQREERERQHKLEQEKIQMKRDELQQAFMMKLMEPKQENPMMIALLNKMIDDDKKEDPIKLMLMEKMIKEDKKDPMVETFPTMMKTLMDTQGQLFTSQIEMLKKNLERKENMENSDESIRKLKAINEYVINPVIETFGPSLASKLQGVSPSATPPTAQPTPTVTEETAPPPVQEVQNPNAYEENIIVQAAQLLMQGKTANDAWQFARSKLNEKQMDFVFKDNKTILIQQAERLINAGYSEANNLINLINKYGEENVIATN